MKHIDDKDWIYNAYVVDMRSTVDIAKELNCEYRTVASRLKKFNIQVRSNTESKLNNNIQFLDNYDWMYKNYITLNKSLSQIAKELNCADKTVGNYLRKLNISLKTVSESKSGIYTRTIEELQEEALKYNFVKEFARGSYSHYQSALARGALKTICSHMSRRNIGFNPNKIGILYYIRIENTDTILYKIGITNYTVKERIQTMEIKRGFKKTIIREILFENGIDAYNEEQRLHKLHGEFSYIGEPIMKNGNTELFIKDVLGLDVAAA